MIEDIIKFLRDRIREDWNAADLVLRPYGDHATTNEAEWWADEKNWMRYHEVSSDEAPLLARMTPQRVLEICKTKEIIINMYLLIPEPGPYFPGSQGRRGDMNFGAKVALEGVLLTMAREYKSHELYNPCWEVSLGVAGV